MYLSRRLNRSLAPPDRVSLNVTLRCNLKCTMCTTCYDAPELSTDEIKGIIDQTAAWGVEVFNPLGGEPFMRHDIEEILDYAVRRGFYVTVTTNATLITVRRAQAIAAIPSDRLHFNISLDGNRASHDLIRGEGMWDRAIQGYQRIRDADRAAGNARRKILANTILHARNVGHFEAVLDEQDELGFDGVQVLNLFRTPDGAPPEAAALWFYDKDIPALESVSAALVLRAQQQGTAGYRLENTPDELRRIPRYYQTGLEPLEAPCWAGWKELYINADGQAIMCDGKLDFLGGAFGSVRDHTLRELWQLPELKQRREVVKACATPCNQKCYLRESSDSLRALAVDATVHVAERAAGRLSTLRTHVEHHPQAVLRLELSDVCPCGWSGCTTPKARWTDLIRGVSGPVEGDDWCRLRDSGQLRFDRGFMGFEVVREVVEDLLRTGIRFGTLALRWRGEPLLHPEIVPILQYLQTAVHARGLADRVRIEIDGRFLSADLEGVVSHPARVDWVVDLDRGGGDLQRFLSLHRTGARLVLAVSATGALDVPALVARYPSFVPAAGRFPEDGGDRLWVRRTDHRNFRDNADARVELQAAADRLGVPVDTGEEDRPRRCAAPALSPVVSWDGKVTLCPTDVQLDHVLGEVTPGRFSDIWRGPGRATAVGDVAVRGVPDQALCRDCAMPWSPNQPKI